MFRVIYPKKIKLSGKIERVSFFDYSEICYHDNIYKTNGKIAGRLLGPSYYISNLYGEMGDTINLIFSAPKRPNDSLQIEIGKGNNQIVEQSFEWGLYTCAIKVLDTVQNELKIKAFSNIFDYYIKDSIIIIFNEYRKI